jgi:hypothetical protein
MSAQGPKLQESVAQLQGHSTDYGAKCRNACYGGIAAAWALHSTGNLNTAFFGLSVACLLSSLAVDIAISSSGVNLLMSKIIEAQERGGDHIDFTSKEAAQFAKRAGSMKWLVYLAFGFIVIGFLIKSLHIHLHFRW